MAGVELAKPLAGSATRGGREQDLTCPNCGAEVQQEDALRCARCRLEWPVREGIPILTRSPIFWERLGREETQKLLEALRSERWLEESQRLAREWNRPGLYKLLVNPTRIAWAIHLPPLPQPWRVLDLGCGCGTLTTAWAQRGAHVVSMDLSFERALFTALRIRQQGLEAQVKVLCGGNERLLPFTSNSFDLVIMNGVLEWVPLASHGHPRETQLAMLREAQRVLRPGGWLYLGIENRFSVDAFRGAPDPHTKLRYISVLPYRVATLYARWRTGKPYRTVTHSTWGYRRLLTQAGFQEPRLFWPRPSYHDIRELIPADQRGTFATRLGQLDEGKPRNLKTLVKIQMARWGLLDWLIPHTSWLVRKPQELANPHGHDVEHLKEVVSGRWQTWCGQSKPARLSFSFRPLPNLEGTMRWLGEATSNGQSFVLKWVTASEDRIRAGREFEIVQQLRQELPPPLSRPLPVPVDSLVHGQMTVFVYRKMAGIPVEHLQGGELDGALEAAQEWLRAFHAATRVPLNPSVVRAKLLGAALQLQERLEPARWTWPYRDVYRLLANLDQELQGLPTSPVFAVCQHGDYHPCNLLWDGQRCGIVDWEESDRRELPFLDWFHLWLNAVQVRTGGNVWQNVLRLEQPDWRKRVSASCRTYAKTIGVDPEWVRWLAFLYFIRRSLRSFRWLDLSLEGLMRFHHRPPTWLP